MASSPAVVPAAGAAFEHHRPALTGHCYRMLGSVVDAEDAVQEAMFRAWKAADRFDGRSSVRTWLYRIATNVCLDLLAVADRRRVRPVDLPGGLTAVPDGFGVEDLARTGRPAEEWVEPIPDALALPADADDAPDRRLVLRESIRLAFVAALQYLPPRQRAALLLTQVLDWSAAETAAALGTSVPAVNSALQRARATLAARSPAADVDGPAPRALSADQARLLARYVAAFEAYDVGALTALLREDATLSMPPYALWLRGPDAIAGWLLGVGAVCRGSHLAPVAACGGTPAFAHYHPGPDGPGTQAWALLMLELRGDRVASMTSYLDVATLFPRFGLPLRRVEPAR
jgi:RNA polymerase sigma-70 factor (ECF subfamily)